MNSITFKITVVLAAAMTVYFVAQQLIAYSRNKKALRRLSNFFNKTSSYSTISVDDGIIIKNVAADDADLKFLIDDINEYIRKSKGTVAFSIIQNKTERRLSMIHDMATSRLTFPTLIGLQGTFAGSFVGLLVFLIGTFVDKGINDNAIQSLITGVIVAMIASFSGLFLLVRSHQKASDASNKSDRDKNEFYEWVQNELMPSVDVSMVEAISKLHETISNFEPSFSSVISQFKATFSDVTQVFGQNFRGSIQVVVNAVDEMGRNIDKINENVRLEQEILDAIQSGQIVSGLEAFVDATKKFKTLTNSLDLFEKARRLMLVTAQETINIQNSYNQQLQVPLKVASEINVILNRITKFEENINGLGVAISQTNLVGNNQVEQIKENIIAINKKQKIAEKYAELSNEQLKKYFSQQKEELAKISQKYDEALQTHLEEFSQMMQQANQELSKRRQEFTDALDQKLSIDEIKSEFSSLKHLADIEKKINSLADNSISGKELSLILKEIKTTLSELNNKAKSTSEAKSKSSIFDSLFGK